VSDEGAGGKLAVWQVIVAAGDARFVQTVVAEGTGGVGQHGQAARAALARLGEAGSCAEEPAALVRYVDVGLLGAGGVEDTGPVVPCKSLWDGEGGRLAAVTVYHSVFE
jgi:diphthine-ammonia ligase